MQDRGMRTRRGVDTVGKERATQPIIGFCVASDEALAKAKQVFNVLSVRSIHHHEMACGCCYHEGCYVLRVDPKMMSRKEMLEVGLKYVSAVKRQAA
jgi:hypothetical protein